MTARLALLLISIFMLPNVMAIEPKQGPYQVVENVASTTFQRINQEWVTQKQNDELLKTIIREEMLPHIDHQFAAFKVLGKNFRSVPKDKLKEYVDTFAEYLVSIYSQSLSNYEKQTVTFEPVSKVSGKTIVVVNGVIEGNNRPSINIAFKVKKNKKDQTWKAFDLIAEGISLVDSKRSEFGAMIRNGGIDDVISFMKEHSQETSLASNTVSGEE